MFVSVFLCANRIRTDVHHRTSLDDERYYRRSLGHTPRRSRPIADSESHESNRHADFQTLSYDEATLRQLLLEYAIHQFSTTVLILILHLCLRTNFTVFAF